MDDIRVGAVLRAVRIRRRLRQADVAVQAGVSRSTISIIENGHLERLSLRSVRQVAAALGVSLPFEPRSRGGELARLADARHAALVSEVVERLVEIGWEVRPEHTFAIYGERGSVDVLAWLAFARALLVVEVKPVLTDLQDTLAALDRKRRLAPRLARDLGWSPVIVGTVLVLPGESQARHSIEEFGTVVRAAYPAGSMEVRQWLRHPAGDLRGLWYLSIANPGNTKQHPGPARRVRGRSGRPDGRAPRSPSAPAARAALGDPPERGPHLPLRRPHSR